MNGFADAADFYARCSSKPLLGAIARPALLLAAADDPLIPAASYADAAPSAQARVLIARGGGHVGFHGAGDGAAAWRDRIVADWFDHCFPSSAAASAAK